MVKKEIQKKRPEERDTAQAPCIPPYNEDAATLACIRGYKTVNLTEQDLELSGVTLQE